LSKRSLGLRALVAIVFFTVSGGAFGLEPLIGAVGPAWAVAMIVLTPIVWSVPIALVAAELSSAIPEEGGYYVWVRRGLGDFWGVQEGWWTMAYSAVSYLQWLWPWLATNDASVMRWLIASFVIDVALLNNWRGARAVGSVASLNALIVLAPFAVLTVIGLSHGDPVQAIARDIHPHQHGLFLLGLSTVLWNYCGWDNVSTFAAEVENPRKNYPRALALGLVLIVVVYLLPVVAALGRTTDPEVWNAGWPVIARAVAGKWTSYAIAGVALVSAWSLFDGQLLYVSRLPFIMARDGWLPKPLAYRSARTDVPSVALLTTCAVTTLFVTLPFAKLVVLDIVLYSAALVLELFALVALRRREPDLERPFAVPGGRVGIALVATGLLGCSGAVAWLGFRDATATELIALGAVVVGGAMLYLLRRSAGFRDSG
jgi:amino acid transporter